VAQPYVFIGKAPDGAVHQDMPSSHLFDAVEISSIIFTLSPADRPPAP
jgi:hypothetical protein